MREIKKEFACLGSSLSKMLLEMYFGSSTTSSHVGLSSPVLNSLAESSAKEEGQPCRTFCLEK